MIGEFLADAPPGAARTLQVLAVAESLTDQVAEELYAIRPLPGVSGALFLDALRQASFIEPRNSEWSIERSARHALLTGPDRDIDALTKAHQVLLRYADSPDPDLAGDVIPNYLYTLGGRAYHQAGVGRVDEAVENYGEAAVHQYSGAQWLAGQLADLQEQMGVLPSDRLELLFLRAITLFREGRREEARPLIERVVEKNEVSRQTAIALNILGNMVARTQPARAEELLRRSIDMGKQFHDDHGVAIGQHNLARVIARQPARVDEAIQLLKDSIGYGENNNLQHAAQARHTYGYILNQYRYMKDAAEAESQLRRAIDELTSVHDFSGGGQAMHTLALLVSRDKKRRDEAEFLFRRSIEIGERTGDRLGVAMRTFTFGKELARGGGGKRDEAVSTLKRAREMMLSLRKMKEVGLIDAKLADLESKHN